MADVIKNPAGSSSAAIQLDDNITLSLGTGSDALLSYDGTDTILDLQAVGTGGLMVAMGDSFPGADNGSVHLWKGSAGSVNASTNALLVLENNGLNYIHMLAPSAGGIAGLVVGDATASFAAQFVYAHSADSWTTRINNVNELVYTSGNYDFQVDTTISGLIGLTFAATASPSADANTLDDYEEGTWTPGIADSSLDGTGESQAYSIAVGWYTKVGRHVSCGFRILATSLGTLTSGDPAYITGLPFTSSATANYYGSADIGYAVGMTLTAGQSLVGYISPNTPRVILRVWDAAGGTSAATIADLSANVGIIGTISYIV